MLRQGSRNTFLKKMFQDLKNSIYYPILTIFGGDKHNGSFNPYLLKFRVFVVLNVTEHAQIVWKLQSNSARVNFNLNKQNLHSILLETC